MARKRSNTDEDLLISMITRLDDIREATARLHASFEAHLKQDEQFYLEVKDLAESQNKIAERLGEYNSQLALHIAGVNELRKQTAILETTQAKIIEESDARLARIEKPYVWVEFSGNIIRAGAKIATICTAIYGLIKFLHG